MKKIKFLIVLILGILSLFILTGCGQKETTVGIVASPKEFVFAGNFDDTKLDVYKVYNTGRVAKYDELRFNIKDTTNPNIKEVEVIDNLEEKFTDSFKVLVNKESAVINFGEEFYGITYKKLEIPFNEQKEFREYLFVNGIGGYFDFKNFTKGVEVKLIKSKDEVKVLSFNNYIENTIKIKQRKDFDLLSFEEKIKFKKQNKDNTVEFLENNGKNFSDARYNVLDNKEVINTYLVNLQHPELSSKIQFKVFVVGGEKPIHKNVFGWFDYISVSWIGWLMGLLSFGGIFGLGILFTTIIIRSLAWPIYAKTNGMSSKMAQVQPEMEKIKQKYAGRTDKESQRQMQMETMQVYRKNKIGFGSMLLPFVQMPIFIAMYNTVRRILIHGGYYTDQVLNTKFLGVDLAIGSHWTSYILAAIVGVTMLLIQFVGMYKPKYQREKQRKNQQQDKQAKNSGRMMMIVSLVMVIMMVVFSYRDNAMAMYWIFGNIFSLFQVCLYKYIDYRKHLKKEDKELI